MYVINFLSCLFNQSIISMLRVTFLTTLLFSLFMLPSCSEKDDDINPDNNPNDTTEVNEPEHKTWIISPGESAESDAQEAMILMENSDTIHFESGEFNLSNTLSIVGKDGVVIRGEGSEETILNFDQQTAGAQGILATDMTDFIIMDLTIQDPIGDGIKIKDSDGIVLLRMSAIYSGPADPSNGAYGLYPITSHNVLVEDCYVRGASDAGIYVGQSEHIVVRGNFVEECVAGIEIENCKYADVYNNTATKNTGGLLVFDLPNLPVIPNGEQCRVFNNSIYNNNHINFAPEGNIVAAVPPGTGILLLSANQVEIFNNTITSNNMIGIGAIGYRDLIFLDPSQTFEDENYDQDHYNLTIHDNVIQNDDVFPEHSSDLSSYLSAFFTPETLPEIFIGGQTHPELTIEEHNFCIFENPDALVAILNIPFINTYEYDPTAFNCAGTVLPEVVLDIPELP